MTLKRILCPARLRQIPAQFSWVDHRLVRDRHIERCDPPAAALYLFLITVADEQGLSYYSDTALARVLSMTPARLSHPSRSLTVRRQTRCSQSLNANIRSLQRATSPCRP